MTLHTNTEYDSLTGYVEREYTVEWTDKTGNLWRKTCRVINLGRPDRGIAVDPDAMIEHVEAFGRSSHMEAANVAKRAARDERWAKLRVQLVAHLQEHGPMGATELAEVVGLHRFTVREQLHAEPDVYCRMGKAGNAILFGLVGVHDGEAGAVAAK